MIVRHSLEAGEYWQLNPVVCFISLDATRRESLRAGQRGDIASRATLRVEERCVRYRLHLVVCWIAHLAREPWTFSRIAPTITGVPAVMQNSETGTDGKSGAWQCYWGRFVDPCRAGCRAVVQCKPNRREWKHREFESQQTRRPQQLFGKSKIQPGREEHNTRRQQPFIRHLQLHQPAEPA